MSMKGEPPIENRTMNIERFDEAQEVAYSMALGEIKAGRKTLHWIWFIFPQLKGLGSSYRSSYYGIDGLEEARAYVEHPLLNERLREITTELLKHSGGDIRYIMGSGIDAKKLCSSMTLFDVISPDDIYNNVLDVFFDGKRCSRTLTMLNKF